MGRSWKTDLGRTGLKLILAELELSGKVSIHLVEMRQDLDILFLPDVCINIHINVMKPVS